MIPWESCVLWLGYPLQNGVWPDVSKHDNDGFITGAWWEGDSLQFDGIDDYINCGNHSSLNITGAITVEAWVKAAVFPNYAMIITKGDVGFAGSWELRYTGTTGKVEFNCYSTGYNVRAGTTITTLDKWYHIAGVYDTNDILLYVNGASEGTRPSWTGGAINICAVNVDVGRRHDGYYYNGAIGEVRIHNRALNAVQIKEHYEQSYRLI